MEGLKARLLCVVDIRLEDDAPLPLGKIGRAHV